jgi:transcriptional regulator with XRE-family HTH domain
MTKYIQKIKELRIEKGLSQEQVAQAIGVSRPTYGAIEAGKQSLDLDEAQKLANFLGIDITELVSGTIQDIEKYKHMILTYLRMNLSKDGKVPKTKLAKLLYLADFAWFYDHLESMSGMQYRKLTYGPVPDTFFRALDELEESGKVNIDRKKDDDKDIFLISESENNKNEKIQSVSDEEKVLMKKIAEKWKDKKTQDIVNFTHNQLPYLMADDEGIVSYALITQEDPHEVY